MDIFTGIGSVKSIEVCGIIMDIKIYAAQAAGINGGKIL